MKKRVIVRRININLRQPEAVIVERAESEGYEISEIVRGMIREWGKEKYPPIPAYAEAWKINAELKKRKVEEQDTFAKMSNDEYATDILHGKIVGNQVEFRIANGQGVYFLLNSIKEQTIENNPVIQIHNQLLNRTFVFPNGQEPSEAQYAMIFKDWERKVGVEENSSPDGE